MPIEDGRVTVVFIRSITDINTFEGTFIKTLDELGESPALVFYSPTPK